MKFFAAIILFSTLSLNAETNITKQVLSKDCMMGILHNICYWHLDDHSFFERDADSFIEIYLKPLQFQHDPKDRSQYFEMVIPDLNLCAKLKKADYAIPELGSTITNQNFKIVNISRERNIMQTIKTNQFKRFEVEEKDLHKYIFEKRNHLNKIDPKIIKSLRKALPEILDNFHKKGQKSQIFFVAPITQYNNKIAIFWQNTKQLIVLSGDADLDQDIFWESLELHMDIYDLEGDVVTSLSQRLGSNAYITKNWVGRLLYNCVIDGTKVEFYEKKI